MIKIIGLILFSSLLIGCSDASSTDVAIESIQPEQTSSESSAVSKDGFEFTLGVNPNNVSHADEENYVTIEGISHNDKKIHVIYEGTVLDSIDIDDTGFFKYYNKSNEEITLIDSSKSRWISDNISK